MNKELMDLLHASPISKRTIYAETEELEAFAKLIAADCVKTAKTFHDFGPNTQCPSCGKSDHVLRCYTIGRDDAAEAIRSKYSVVTPG